MSFISPLLLRSRHSIHVILPSYSGSSLNWKYMWYLPHIQGAPWIENIQFFTKILRPPSSEWTIFLYILYIFTKLPEMKWQSPWYSFETYHMHCIQVVLITRTKQNWPCMEVWKNKNKQTNKQCVINLALRTEKIFHQVSTYKNWCTGMWQICIQAITVVLECIWIATIVRRWLLNMFKVSGATQTVWRLPSLAVSIGKHWLSRLIPTCNSLGRKGRSNDICVAVQSNKRLRSIYGPRQANLCLRAFRHDKF